MELNARQLFTLIAMVEQIEGDRTVVGLVLRQLIDILAERGAINEVDRNKLLDLERTVAQLEREQQLAANQPVNPMSVEVMRGWRELRAELAKCGVLDEETLADSLNSEFLNLQELVLYHLRKEQGHTE